jgi:predicted RNase H-like HicB family nuclease
MKKVELKSVVWKDGKYYTAQCLNVEVASFGRTKKVAMANLSEAVDLYFEGEKSPCIQKVNRPELFGLSVRYA